VSARERVGDSDDHPDTPLLETCRRIRARSRSVRLPDGRRLGYADRGDPDGAPLLLFHGFPNSRVFAALFDDIGRERGIRILAPERPGIGISDPLPGREFAEWAHDVEAFLDALELDAVPVLGVSAGGPYALACGAHVPDRVTGVGALCPVGRRAALGLRDRLPFSLGAHLPRTWRLTAWRRRRRARADPAGFLESSAADAPDPDRPLWRGEVGHALLVGTEEGCRRGCGGYTREATVLCSAWDFDPEDVAVPVALAHGEADRIVPVAMGRDLADRLPDVDATFVAELGHLSLVEDQRASVLGRLDR
jgi:pimeloyl-ACP methyl ester carboxylesterase